MQAAGTLNIKIAIALAAIFVAALVGFGLTVSPPDRAVAAGGGCPNANSPAQGTSSEALGDAIECLIAQERRQADRRRLDPVGSIDRVAEKHTDVMIKEDCLDHQCGDETTLKKRIVRSGYPIPGGRYGFGEITGCSLTPQGMVDAWMRTETNRERILGSRFRDIGIGADKGNPNVRGCTGTLRGVYTVIFAWRRG
jgi:uncharacterized protein YkwD